MEIKCIFTIALLLLGVGTHAEEKCDQKQDNKLFDQSFGMELTPEDIFTSMMNPWRFPAFPAIPSFQDYFRPWRQLATLSKDLGSTIKVDKDKFQVNLDVQHFSPDEISVKIVDGYVVIEAKHEEKKDEHGYISRQFSRRYALPEGTEAENVISELSSDGILTITAPRKPVEDHGERVVPIKKTGPVRMESMESKESNAGTCQANDKSCDSM